MYFFKLIKKYNIHILFYFIVLFFALVFLYKRLLYVAALRSVPQQPVAINQPADPIDWRLLALTVTPTPSLQERIGIVPEYQPGEYLKFVNYTHSYEIQYPAGYEDIELGGEAGDFTYKFKDKNEITYLHIIWTFKADQSLNSINLGNIENITIPGMGGPTKIIYPEEKLVRKELTSIDSVTAYKVITQADEVNERIIVPRLNDMFILQVDYKINKNPEADKVIKTFRFYPPVPQNWLVYSDSKFKGIKFKYPPEFKITASDKDDGTYEVTLASDKGNITFYAYKEDSELGRLFGDYYGYTNEAAIKAENLLKENIKDSKFSTNAFSIFQGGDSAVRVVHPYSQNLNVYFHILENKSRVRVNAPLSLESTLNQILKSLYDFYKGSL